MERPCSVIDGWSATGEMEVFVRKVWVWLSRRVLPVWAREALLGQIRELEEENRRLRQEVALKEEYIHGLKWGVRAQRRAVAEEGKG